LSPLVQSSPTQKPSSHLMLPRGDSTSGIAKRLSLPRCSESLMFPETPPTASIRSITA